MILTKRILIEFEVLAAIFAVTVLTIIIFTRPSLNENAQVMTIAQSTFISIFIYGGFLLLTFIFILIKRTTWVRYLFSTLLSIITLRNIDNLYLLIVNRKISDNGAAILSDAMLIWITSLFVFSLWYWIIDRGGPVARQEERDETRYDLLFPQYQNKIPGWERWHPRFLDYLFFSFFTSTGFSPADTLPLTKRIKLMMMTEASISLIIIGMVASRAISLIK